MKQSDEIQATTVVATGMENLKSYGERDRGVYKLPHFYVQRLSCYIVQDMEDIVCSLQGLWLEKESLQNVLATFKHKCPVLLRNMILQFGQPCT